MSALVEHVTRGEVNNTRKTVFDVAEELNELFANKSVRDLLREEKVSFWYHPKVFNGDLGEEYREGTIAWSRDGALEELMNMLDKDVTDNVPKFVPGIFGSVWIEVQLTGGKGAARRTKRVRVLPTPGEEDGTWNIVLDNTFDKVW